jgi:hypothetical protein
LDDINELLPLQVLPLVPFGWLVDAPTLDGYFGWLLFQSCNFSATMKILKVGLLGKSSLTI